MTTTQLSNFGPADQRATAVALDAADPLAHFRDQFVITNPDLRYSDICHLLLRAAQDGGVTHLGIAGVLDLHLVET